MSVCDKATYNIKTGDGKFKVRIFIQIANAVSNVNFQVNGTSFAKNLTIDKGERKVLEEVVNASDGMIEIDTECKDNCFYSLGRMNMIQIFPYVKLSHEPSHPLHEGQICDGLVKRGKECENGPDVTHCAFQDNGSPGYKLCNGSVTKVKIPEASTCKDIRGWNICIKNEYETNEAELCGRICGLVGFQCKDLKCVPKS